MTDLTLTQALGALTPVDAGLTAPVPLNWAQGRTAYGGYTAAVLLAAARHGRTDLPPLRSALVNFTAPVSEPPVIATELLRQGRNVTTLHSRASVGGKPAALGTFTFGQAQDSHVSQNCPAPQADTPENTEPFIPANVSRMPARFFENFEVKLIAGDRPFSGAERGYVRVWVRHRDPDMRNSLEGLLALADVLPPAAFVKSRKIGPNSSMTWICNFLQEDASTKNGWWMAETDLTAAQDGYSSQVMRVWNSAGDLVVEGMQSVVIFV